MDCDEYRRWILQAEDTLRSSRHDISGGFYQWACFKSQQAAEFASKALLTSFGFTAHGHSIVKLLSSLKLNFPRKCASDLDKLYIGPRYIDAIPDGVPRDFYYEEDAEYAIQCSETIIDWVRAKSKC